MIRLINSNTAQKGNFIFIDGAAIYDEYIKFMFTAMVIPNFEQSYKTIVQITSIDCEECYKSNISRYLQAFISNNL